MKYSTAHLQTLQRVFLLGVIALRYARLEARDTLRKLFKSDSEIRRVIEEGARAILNGSKPRLIGSTPARKRECQRACYNLAAKCKAATEELRVLTRSDTTVRHALLRDVRAFQQGKEPSRYAVKDAASSLAWRIAVETLAEKLDRNPLGLERIERVAMGTPGIKQGTRLNEGRYRAVSKHLTPETVSLNIQTLKKYRADITPAEAARLSAADEAEGHYCPPHVVHHHNDGHDHSRDRDPRVWAHAQTPEIETYDARSGERVTYQDERRVLLDYRWDDGSPLPGAKQAAAKLMAKQKPPEPKGAWLSVEIDGTLEQHRVWVQDLIELTKGHRNSYRAYEPIRVSTQRDEITVRKLTPQEKKDLVEAKKEARALEEARRKQLEQDALDVGVPEGITLSEYQALLEERDLDLKWTALERNCPPELLGFIMEERRARSNRLAREKRRNARRLPPPVTWVDTIQAGL